MNILSEGVGRYVSWITCIWKSVLIGADGDSSEKSCLPEHGNKTGQWPSLIHLQCFEQKQYINAISFKKQANKQKSNGITKCIIIVFPIFYVAYTFILWFNSIWYLCVSIITITAWRAKEKRVSALLGGVTGTVTSKFYGSIQNKDLWYSIIFQWWFHLEAEVQNRHAILRQQFMSL